MEDTVLPPLIPSPGQQVDRDHKGRGGPGRAFHHVLGSVGPQTSHRDDSIAVCSECARNGHAMGVVEGGSLSRRLSQTHLPTPAERPTWLEAGATGIPLAWACGNSHPPTLRIAVPCPAGRMECLFLKRHGPVCRAGQVGWAILDLFASHSVTTSYPWEALILPL